MSTIGRIEMVPIGRNMYVCTQVLTLETGRQSWSCLKRFKCSILRMIAITYQSGIQFIDQIGILSVGMERQMTRARTRRDLYLSMFVQLPVFQVHSIDHEFIQA